jgi:preprotein translocase subunit YajC
MQVDPGAALVNVFLALIPLVMIIGLFYYAITSLRDRFK